MEECEALCTRLVIMVNGEFKCLGSPQHLKTKFGNGYKLSIRLNDEVSNTEALFKFMKENFPASINTETHKNLFEYILPFNSTKLSQIFGTIEKNREILNIKDYSVTQTTLDQIFVNFAKSQNEEAFADTQIETNFEIQNTLSNLQRKQSINKPIPSRKTSLISENHEPIDENNSENNETEIADQNLEDKNESFNHVYDSMYYEDSLFPEPLPFNKDSSTRKFV